MVRQLIGDRFSEENSEKIIEELVSGKYTHDDPITKDTAGNLLGACVQAKLPTKIHMLMRLYRMETRPRRPGVEFVPVMPSSK